MNLLQNNLEISYHYYWPLIMILKSGRQRKWLLNLSLFEQNVLRLGVFGV
jgi:hypothetical protein